MWQFGVGVAARVNVQEAGTGDPPGHELAGGIARRPGQVPGPVQDDEAVPPEIGGQPVGRDSGARQRVRRRPLAVGVVPGGRHGSDTNR